MLDFNYERYFKNNNLEFAVAKKNYSDTIFTRYRKLKPTPAQRRKKGRRDIGTNTLLQHLVISSPVKLFQKYKVSEQQNPPVMKIFPSKHKPMKLLEMEVEPGFVPSFDPYCSSSEEIIQVGDHTDINAMVNTPCKIGFGIESSIVRRKFGL